LLSIQPHDRGGGLDPNADTATLVNEGILGGNSPGDIFGSQYRRHVPPP
jgi:hypothetical protein